MQTAAFELKKITNSELNLKIKSLAENERKLTKIIIEHIAEVDRRKLYLSMAYPSLFEYLIKEIGYSAASAQRRIDAARLYAQVPAVAEKIESGSLNLSQISQMQKAIRDERKINGNKVSFAKKEKLMAKLEHKNRQETELILAQEFALPIEFAEKAKIQKDESVRFEFTLTAEEMAIFEEAKALLSHSVPGGSAKEVFTHLLKRYIKQRKAISSTAKILATEKIKSAKVTSAAEVTTQQKSAIVIAKAVSLSNKKFVLNKDMRCQYKDPTTGRICNSPKFLQIDHIKPRWAGGENQPENLRALCANHNRYRYQIGK